jgi:hypothetical protein
MEVKGCFPRHNPNVFEWEHFQLAGARDFLKRSNYSENIFFFCFFEISSFFSSPFFFIRRNLLQKCGPGNLTVQVQRDTRPGWPEWANFRLLGDYLLWEVFLKITEVVQNFGLLVFTAHVF